MFKEWKIVKHYMNKDDFLYRIYRREWFFFWSWEATRTTIESCSYYINEVIQEETIASEIIENTPKDELITYL